MMYNPCQIKSKYFVDQQKRLEILIKYYYSLLICNVESPVKTIQGLSDRCVHIIKRHFVKSLFSAIGVECSIYFPTPLQPELRTTFRRRHRAVLFGAQSLVGFRGSIICHGIRRMVSKTEIQNVQTQRVFNAKQPFRL